MTYRVYNPRTKQQETRQVQAYGEKNASGDIKPSKSTGDETSVTIGENLTMTTRVEKAADGKPLIVREVTNTCKCPDGSTTCKECRVDIRDYASIIDALAAGCGGCSGSADDCGCGTCSGPDCTGRRRLNPVILYIDPTAPINPLRPPFGIGDPVFSTRPMSVKARSVAVLLYQNGVNLNAANLGPGNSVRVDTTFVPWQ